MICKSCADEADGNVPEAARCPQCGKTVQVTRVGRVLRTHKPDSPRAANGYQRFPRCAGSGKVPVWGHAACPGCDCHHQPVVRS